MIFVATGTQFPFDRLIQIMDKWAQENDEKVIAQIGDGKYTPEHIEWQRFVGIDEYNKNIKESTLFISHAGMGNIISAKEQGTPIVVINRQAKLGEHRNDHQAEGLEWMGKLEGVYTATDKDTLFAQLAQREQLQASSDENNQNLNTLVDFIDQLVG
ncbi:MAG: glycosyl transferase family 28 [Thiotrichaceae bacterium]|nr:glycosyl transferase family 28 [Thiotrichaceae bacterium]